MARQHTTLPTDNHCDSKTELAQWADAVKLYGVAQLLTEPPLAYSTPLNLTSIPYSPDKPLISYGIPHL